MPFAEPMFPGQVHDSAARAAADMAARLDRDGRAETHAALRDMAVEMGWTLALLPEERGGLGLGYEGLTAMAEALGAEGSPVPLAASACAVTEIAALCPTGIRDRLDAALAEGRAITALFGSAVDDQIADGKLTVTADGGALSLSGRCTGIEGGVTPDPLLLLVPDGAGIALLEVTARDAKFEPCARMDTRPGQAVSFDRPARLEPLARLDPGAVSRIEDRAALIVAAEAIGAAFRALDLTIAYLNEREQFGTALSTFQVLRHKVVDIYVAAMVTRGAVMDAVLALDAGQDNARDVALAVLEMRNAAWQIGKEVVQVHGGIGMTDALPAAKLARRLLMTEYEYGSRARTLARLSEPA